MVVSPHPCSQCFVTTATESYHREPTDAQGEMDTQQVWPWEHPLPHSKESCPQIPVLHLRATSFGKVTKAAHVHKNTFSMFKKKKMLLKKCFFGNPMEKLLSVLLLLEHFISADRDSTFSKVSE